MCFFSVGLLIYRQPNRPPPSLSNCTYCELTTNIDAELVCVWGGGGTYWGQTTENVTSFLATETKERYGITDTRRMSMWRLGGILRDCGACTHQTKRMERIFFVLKGTQEQLFVVSPNENLLFLFYHWRVRLTSMCSPEVVEWTRVNGKSDLNERDDTF